MSYDDKKKKPADLIGTSEAAENADDDSNSSKDEKEKK